MELTSEVIADVVNGKITPCELCDSMAESPVREMAKMLLAEMDKPKVWDGAPEKSTYAEVWFGDSSFVGCKPDKTYKRELPKSPEREIAERRSKVIVSTQMTERELIADQIEAAITEYKESIK